MMDNRYILEELGYKVMQARIAHQPKEEVDGVQRSMIVGVVLDQIGSAEKETWEMNDYDIILIPKGKGWITTESGEGMDADQALLNLNTDYVWEEKKQKTKKKK